MAQALVKNNAYSTLAASISAVVTTITVDVGHGSRFPTISDGNFFYATLIDVSNVLEIVKVVGRAGDVFTVTRGQDGTIGHAYTAGDRIELRPTAALFDNKLSKGGGVMTGHIEAIAGAATTQVPQIQEVVQRAGDSMTGPLTVPELRGVGGVVELPTGHRVLGADIGSLVAPGMVVQQVNVQTGEIVTTTAIIPWDNSIPQITEGAEAFTLAITPKFTTSKLRIDITIITGVTSSARITAALFRDAGVNALAAASALNSNDNPGTLNFTHYMNAPGVGTYTFRVRFGPDSAVNTVLNGYNSARKLGGISASSMTIMEIAA